eukprot:6180593-Pleurochrysis_carterae.AAC.1
MRATRVCCARREGVQREHLRREAHRGARAVEVVVLVVGAGVVPSEADEERAGALLDGDALDERCRLGHRLADLGVRRGGR